MARELRLNDRGRVQLWEDGRRISLPSNLLVGALNVDNDWPGGAGSEGPQGDPGEDGATWIGDPTEPPTSPMGNNGDWFLRASTGDVYFKSGGAWTIIGSIKGATGTAGTDGSDGVDGDDGIQGIQGIQGIPGTAGVVTVGTGLDLAGTDLTLDLSEVASGGELGGNMDAPTVDATHSGSTHAATQAAAESTAAGALATHAAASDPHTGYRLESADHTHASSGIQGGQVAHSALSGISATDHHVAPAAGPDGDITNDAAGAAGTASTFARSGHGHKVITDTGVASTQAFGDTATAGTSGTIQRGGHKHAMPSLGTAPSTQAFGDAAAGGSATDAAKTDHKHAFPALGTTPSTQAFADAAAGGSATTPSKNDHKHAMPTLGYGLSGNAAPAVGLSQVSAFATATTSVSAATYADVTGVSITLAAGTWLIMASCTGSIVNAQAIMHAAITDAANAIVAEGSQGIGASGTASVAQLGNVSLMAIVTPGVSTAYKLRAARGLTTITGTWVAMDGAGTNTTNNLTDNSDKGTGIFAIRLA